MSSHTPERASDPARYWVRVQERIDGDWDTWLGMAVRYEVTGQTVLEGELVDQAALYGLIARLRDLGLTLLSVQRLDESCPPDSS